MALVVNALQNLGAWSVLAIFIIAVIRGCLVWHHRFVLFDQNLHTLLHRVNMAALQGNWKDAAWLLNEQLDLHSSSMQIFNEEQRHFIIRQKICVLEALNSKDKTKIENALVNFTAGFTIFCNKPFRQIYQCPIEFLKTMFCVVRKNDFLSVNINRN